MSLLLNHYCFDCVGNSTFAVTFSIPNNCSYATSCVAKTNFITIQLQAGQTKPSKVFTVFTEQFTADPIDNTLDVQFVQIYAGTTTKPKIKIDL